MTEDLLGICPPVSMSLRTVLILSDVREPRSLWNMPFPWHVVLGCIRKLEENEQARK